MTEFPESLERRIAIRATPETVFRYFTDSARFARWWGEGSTIEGRAGGAVKICLPGGNTVHGEVREIDPPRRVVFTYRYASGVPEGGSLVTVTLAPDPEGTLLHLTHAFSSGKIRDAHVQGWRYQLALFSKAIADDSLAGAVPRIDAAFAAWGETDAARRRELLAPAVTEGIAFRDAFSATDGLDELLANLEAVQLHMPGATLAREGDVRVSHGTALARWTAKRADGQPLGRGVNVYELAPDGRIARIVGFWEG